MVIRQIPFKIKTFEQLNLPKVIADLSDKPNLAAYIERLNARPALQRAWAT